MSDVRAGQGTFDCADPGALSAFWRKVLGYAEEPLPSCFTSFD